MTSKAKRHCQFAEKSLPPCDITLPKPNQLCASCRPHWNNWQKHRNNKISPVKKD